MFAWLFGALAPWGSLLLLLVFCSVVVVVGPPRHALPLVRQAGPVEDGLAGGNASLTETTCWFVSSSVLCPRWIYWVVKGEGSDYDENG